MRQIGRWWSVQAVSIAKSKWGVLRLRFFKTTFLLKVFLLNPDYAHLDLTCFGYIIVTNIYVYSCMYMHLYTYAVPSHHHPLLWVKKFSPWEGQYGNGRNVGGIDELRFGPLGSWYHILFRLRIRCLEEDCLMVETHVNTGGEEKVKICGMKYGYDWYMINMPWLVSVDMISIHFAEFLPSDQWTFWQ